MAEDKKRENGVAEVLREELAASGGGMVLLCPHGAVLCAVCITDAIAEASRR